MRFHRRAQLSTCLFIIDDFNERYQGIPIHSEALRKEADNFSEADLVVRIGYPFRQMANFVMQSSKGKKENGNDIIVKSKDFRIEVKFLDTYESGRGRKTNKSPWGPILEDFQWLMKEIQDGNKDKRAFIIGWFNATDRFSQQIQLGLKTTTGRSPGSHPVVDLAKIQYLPFINYEPGTKSTASVTYRYENAFIQQQLNIPGYIPIINCLFLGRPEDVFHLAIYF